MIRFSKELELTYVEQKVSKTGNIYMVVRFISENGQTIDVMYKGSRPIQSFKLRENYNFQFEYTSRGKYSNIVCLEILDIE